MSGANDRAVLRAPKVLAIDEATANIDLETDAVVQQSIRAKFAGATTLTIAHRLQTILDSDLIVTMDAGRVAEVTTHIEIPMTPHLRLTFPAPWLLDSNFALRRRGAPRSCLQTRPRSFPRSSRTTRARPRKSVRPDPRAKTSPRLRKREGQQHSAAQSGGVSL